MNCLDVAGFIITITLILIFFACFVGVTMLLLGEFVTLNVALWLGIVFFGLVLLR